MASHHILAGLLFLVWSSAQTVSAKHIHGIWTTGGNINPKYVAKFAFDVGSHHTAYVYGNVTASPSLTSNLTLVFMNQSYIDDFTGGSSCSQMFGSIGDLAYDARCNPNGTIDMMRQIPCNENEVCENQKDPTIPGYQFTFTVENNMNSIYWYVVISSCFRNGSDPNDCQWLPDLSSNEELHYDIWLVNDYPGNDTDFFTHQYSIDQQALPQIFIAFTLLYFVLNLVHFIVQRIPKHPVILMVTLSIFLEFIAISFGCIHHVKYGFDGVGEPVLREAGRCLDEIVQCLFVLLLLLLARGWRITRIDIRQKPLLFVVWSGYSLVYLTLVLISIIVGDPLSNQSYYDIWWGICVLSLRAIIIIWFFFELRATYRQENEPDKLLFYRLFGFWYCVWFIWLPVAVIIVSQINQVIRAKLLIGLELSADFVSLCSMVIWMLPPLRDKYFTIDSLLDNSSQFTKSYDASYQTLPDISRSR